MAAGEKYINIRDHCKKLSWYSFIIKQYIAQGHWVLEVSHKKEIVITFHMTYSSLKNHTLTVKG